ncbi:hypothetical protein KSP39_PZI005521 [Platanthera zijinensis]|uniref:DUF7722 domain-containing protein n=1 Tax=Platanthera zijinensis TaxID=2320716 RepID=A0AAP0BT63_9ASPA
MPKKERSEREMESEWRDVEVQTSGGERERLSCGYGCCSGETVEVFKMPVNYPRYSLAEYESMPEWKLDFLLTEYGLPVGGSLEYKRNFAAGAFLWSPSR